MQKLTKKEWIAVTIVLVVIVIFFGSRFFNQAPQPGAVDKLSAVEQDGLNAITDTGTAAATTTTTTTTTIKNNTNMNQNNLIIKDVVVGTGAEAKNGNLVSVQYTGKFADGKVFDSSIPRGQPIQFTLGAGQVIPGWDQGILGMKVGGKRTLTIPPALGYGAAGFPPVIPPNSTLYFDVELTAVQVQ